MSTELERAEQARIDWAIGEVVGGRTAPDLLAAVRQRLQRPAAATAAAGASRWFAAACVMVGLGATTAIWCGKAGAPRDGAVPAQQPVAAPVATEPAWVEVADHVALAGLPADCTAVRMLAPTGGDVDALARLQQLTHLDLGLAAVTGAASPLDAAVLQAAGKLTTLRELRLDYRTEIQPDWLAPLAALPLLETLRLRFTALGDGGAAQLTRLPSLRRLTLAFDPSLGDTGLRALAAMPALRELSLRGCGGLGSEALKDLAKATQLEVLDLAAVNGVPYQLPAMNTGKVQPAMLPRLEQMLMTETGMSGRGNGGVTDAVLLALKPLTKLRELQLQGCSGVSAVGFAALAGCPLRQLGLGLRQGEFAPFVPLLPPTIERLDVSYCRTLGDAEAEALARRLPMLQQLDLTQCTALGDAGLRALLQNCPLRQLDIRGCRGLSADSLKPLLAKTTLRQLVVSGLSWVDAEAEQQLRARPELQLENRRGGVMIKK